jgi:hypothetical protein
MLGVMDITQILIILGAVLGTVVVGLVAIVPTLLEIPHDHDTPNGSGHPAAPSPLRRRRRSGVAPPGRHPTLERPPDIHKLAA